MAHSKAQVEAMHAKGFCTAWEMAEASGLHLTTIHRYFTEGTLLGVRVGKAYFVQVEAAIKVWPALETDIRGALDGIFARSREKFAKMLVQRTTGRQSAPTPRIGSAPATALGSTLCPVSEPAKPKRRKKG